jgi:uncharacterized surface protein with fasciclin (FAS1) repeats
MKIKKQIKNLALVAFVAIVTLSCSKSDSPTVTIPEVRAKTIIELLQADPTNYSVLMAALTKTDLVTALNGTTKLTLFAPTDDAFTNANPRITITDINVMTPDKVAALKQTLLNHVIGTEVKAVDLPTAGYIKTLAKFDVTSTATLSMYVAKTDVVTLNGGAKVLAADIIAANGVIHKIDKIINLPTIRDHIKLNITLSKLNSSFGVFSNGFIDNDATTANPLTIFAPTNIAFANATISAADSERVLTYHLVDGNKPSTSLIEGQEISTKMILTAIAAKKSIFITLTGGVKVQDTGGTAPNNKSNVTTSDIQGTNGVIHIIDRVLKPNLN